MEPESTVEAELHRLRVEVAELRAALIERSELSRRSASERVPTGRRAFVKRAGLAAAGLIGAAAALIEPTPDAANGAFHLDSVSNTVHVGAVVTSGLFYDPRLGMMQRWRDRGHLGVKMEVAMLYMLAAIEHREGVALMAVSDLIADEGTELISDDELRHGVDEMMRVACRVAVS